MYVWRVIIGQVVQGRRTQFSASASFLASFFFLFLFLLLVVVLLLLGSGSIDQGRLSE